MTEPTQEQIKEFWEWCGLKGKWAEGGKYLKFPRLNLTNLFKYAVPLILEELKRLGVVIPLIELFTRWYDKIISLSGDSSDISQITQALFEVCWEVIEKEKAKVCGLNESAHKCRGGGIK